MLSEADVERLGLTVTDPGPRPPREEKTIGIRGPSPRTVSVPKGIDPGFEYRPGARSMALLRSVGTATEPDIAAAYAEAIAPIVGRVVQREYDSWINRVFQAGRARGDVATIGLLRPAELAALQRSGRALQRSDISVEDRLIVGRKSRRHQASDRSLTESEWRALPTLLANRDAALLDLETGRLLIVLRSDGPVKLVIAPDYMSKSGATVNSVRTAFKMNVRALADRTRYELIWGEL